MRILVILAIGSLMVCNSGQDFPVVETDLDVEIAGDEITLSRPGEEDMSVTRSDNYSPGKFVGGMAAAQDIMIASFQSEAAMSTVSIQVGAESVAGQTSVARLIAIDRPSSGGGTYSGTVVGGFVSGDFAGQPVTQTQGLLTLNVDFDDQVINGQIRDRTAYLIGQDFLFTLFDSAGNIDLLDGTINGAGRFDGVAVYPDGDGNSVGQWGGLIAGAGGSQIVGEITMGDELGERREIMVFEATAD